MCIPVSNEGRHTPSPLSPSSSVTDESSSRQTLYSVGSKDAKREEKARKEEEKARKEEQNAAARREEKARKEEQKAQALLSIPSLVESHGYEASLPVASYG